MVRNGCQINQSATWPQFLALTVLHGTVILEGLGVSGELIMGISSWVHFIDLDLGGELSYHRLSRWLVKNLK